jgi:hypothetical protein
VVPRSLPADPALTGRRDRLDIVLLATIALLGVGTVVLIAVPNTDRQRLISPR